MEKEEKEKKIKRKLKWQIKLFLIIIFIILCCFLIGTKGIFIKEFKIETNKISKKETGLKILHFSDLHYGSSIDDKDLKNLINKINLTKPDIVIFTGDLVDQNYKINKEEEKNLTKYLNKINATLGKYYVTGEEDNENTQAILNLSTFINVDNNEQIIYLNDNTPILLTGKDNAKRYFETNENINIFKILAIHNPDDIDEYLDYNFDLALAGHTHNGQINIPKLKDLLIESKYIKNYQKINNTKLFINPGIGTSKINVRLFNHPTIYLYRINKAST